MTRVYRSLSPTVVNIVAHKLVRNFWMQVVPQTGQGTGFVIDSRGYILTNNHVVGNAENLEVTFLGDRKLNGQLLARDPVSDLAVIKVEPFKGMKVAPIGDSDKLSVGQRVVAIGNPFGLQHTVTAGYISALNRDVQINNRVIIGMIQTDAAINPGNSGGPLINAEGKVIGVNSAIYSSSGGFMGIGLALPINRAKRVAQDMIKWGRAIYPWLGVLAWIDLEPRPAAQVGLPPVKGVLIVQLGQESPAAKAGLHGGNRFATYQGLLLRSRDGRPIVLGGDIILAVDGVKTPTFDKYRNVILEKKVGEKVRVTYLRGKEQHTADITLAPDPRIH